VKRDPGFIIAGVIFLLGMILQFQNCSSEHSGQFLSSSVECDNEVFVPFQEKIHPLLTRNCQGCHSVGQSMSNSPFADTDTAIAFNSFFSQGSHKFNAAKDRIKNNHNVSSWQDTDNLFSLWEAEEAGWSAGLSARQSCLTQKGQSLGLNTSAIDLSQVPECETGSEELSWDLAIEFPDQSIVDSTFSLMVCSFSSESIVPPEYGYQLTSPKVTTGEHDILIGEIQVYFNGVHYSDGTTWNQLLKLVPKQGSEVIGQGGLFVNKGSDPLSDSDRISINFGVLQSQ
jgi:hypothetical protein